MAMNKSEEIFLKTLEAKAREQKKLAGTEVLPRWAAQAGEWLVVNPWRVLVPVSGITYYVLRITLGTEFRSLILGIFGGFK